MTVKSLIATLTQQEDLNFLLTNRVPRAALTRLVGWFSKIEQPVIRDLSIACWRLFSDLDLSEARKTDFKSLHDCFTRELKPGLRPPDPDPSIVVSPCDGIVGVRRLAVAGCCDTARHMPLSELTNTMLTMWKDLPHHDL